VPGDDLRLPDGTILVHIGPPKTGTTAVQGAFHARRREVLAQGVRYAGRSRHSGAAVNAVIGRPSFTRDSGSPPMSRWNALVSDVRGAREPYVLVSSEFFADAEADRIPRIVDDLGRGRVHVVVTLRPLANLLASQWQQYVQSFTRLSFDEWLSGVLDDPPGEVTPTFWRRHRHDALIDRWAAAVGRENVTAVVLDESDHDHVLRVFERLLGLRSGTLEADDDVTNRSMMLPEIEALRAFNIAFHEAGLKNALYHRVMHFGGSAYMRQRPPAPDEARIEVPRWALDRAAEIAREMVDRIAASGVRVIGELERLTAAPRGQMEVSHPPRSCVPPAIAAAMVTGIVVATGGARGSPRVNEVARAGGPAAQGEIPPANGGWTAEPPRLARFATYQLAGVVPMRLVSSLVRFLGRRWRGGTDAGPPTRPASAAETVALDAFESWLRGSGIPARARVRLRAAAASGAPSSIGAESAAAERMAAESVAGNEDCLSPESAAGLAFGVLRASGLVRPAAGASGRGLRAIPFAWAEPPELAVVTSPQLVAAVITRAWRRLLRRHRM
jgi:hypothetical protein